MEENVEAKTDQTEPEPEVAAERKPKLHFRDLRRLAKSHIYKDVEVTKAELQDTPKIANLVEMMLKSMSQDDSEDQSNGRPSICTNDGHPETSSQVPSVTIDTGNEASTEQDHENRQETQEERAENVQRNNSIHRSYETGESKAVVTKVVDIEEQEDIETQQVQTPNQEEEKEGNEEEKETQVKDSEIQESSIECPQNERDIQEIETHENELQEKDKEKQRKEEESKETVLTDQIQKSEGNAQEDRKTEVVETEVAEGGGEAPEGPRASRTCSIL